jgi:DNA-binding beta-propeller fold protein YncE
MISVLALLAACGTERTAPATGSTIVIDRQSVFTANGWDGTVSRADKRSGRIEGELEVGGEPTRMIRLGDELWVTLRAERSVAVLDISGAGAPVETARFKVGAEPYGIAATSDGSRVYVALSQQDQVVELDGATKQELRRWDVMNDPRWLTVHPCDCALFVASAYEAPILRIDLESGRTREIEPPETELPSDDGDPIELTPRNTGDLAISPIGDAIVWPVLYVDHLSPGDQPQVSAADITPPSNPYYASVTSPVGLQLSVSKFNGALVGIPLDTETGEPVPGEDAIALFVGGFADGAPRRGYLSGAWFDDNGTTVYAPLESADAVAVVDLRPIDGQRMDPSVSGDAGPVTTFGFADTAAGAMAPAEGNFYERSQAIVSLAGNPYAVALDDEGQVFVHERGGRRVSKVQRRRVQDYLDRLNTGEFLVDGFSAIARHEVATRRTSDAFEYGRQMFYSSNDARMTTVGSGVSCSTCHFEGRNDGLTWSFDDNPRQTPSLAGNVSETTPVTWTLDVPTVAREAQITTVGRMGGGGLTDAEGAQVEAFVNAIRPVDVEHRGVRDDLVARGEAVFNDPQVGCAECHSGPRGTDNARHLVFDIPFEVDTPTLTGIDATAPYLHDGSAPNLRAVLERVRDGSMGDTSGLSDDDMDALVAYLRTL